MQGRVPHTPIYLAVTIVCFLIVIALGVMRGGLRRRPAGGPAPMRAQGNMLQTVSAILGIVSFFMQVLQWLNII
jgi:hypothetical protein